MINSATAIPWTPMGLAATSLTGLGEGAANATVQWQPGLYYHRSSTLPTHDELGLKEEELEAGMSEIAAGKGVPHAEAMNALRARIRTAGH